jgi:hypothetical protein
MVKPNKTDFGVSIVASFGYTRTERPISVPLSGGAPLHDRLEITLGVRACGDIFQTLYFIRLPRAARNAFSSYV